MTDRNPEDKERKTPLQPRQLESSPPCRAGCPNGTDIRGWISTIAQRSKLGLTDAEAYDGAWRTIVDVNPFPAVLGRICPHPCEAGCNREAKDGAVSINQLERFIGDWAIDRDLSLERLDPNRHPESIGVVGAGPAGLSFAYQMARRGYGVTVYEQRDRPGGMLRYGVPVYRLPEEVLDAEIGRIVALGVELRLGTRIGIDVTLEEIEAAHEVVFLGIGAHGSRRLGIPGEDGPCAWTGTEYLRRVNQGERIELGDQVVVVGGGNTAIDAARCARRGGSEVTLLYRRSRTEMPARDAEVEDALAEGIRIEFLATPVAIDRDSSAIRSIRVCRMRLGLPDESGRRRPVIVQGSEYEMAADSVIAAVSQEPDWEHLDSIRRDGVWLGADATGRVDEHVWAAGDVLGLGIAGTAIARGRQAAEAVHARLRGLPDEAPETESPAGDGKVKQEFYPDRPRAAPPTIPPEDRLSRPDDEIRLGLSADQFLEEIGRCFSCGQCFGCEHCWIYCAHDCFSRLEEVRPGAYFSVALDQCQACGKCIDVCPCGFLEVRPAPEG
jgi:NADPH-dependent glutamate synthase beta subunit-like oxidoreductase